MSDIINPQLARKLRQGFRIFNKFMLLMWRLDLGRWFNTWPEGWGQIMVITHHGRKTGTRHQTPVNYAILDGDVYCMAGFGKISDWYRNIMVNPQVEVWLPDGWWQGRGEDVSEEENRNEIIRAVTIASGFAGPMFGVDPKVLDDQELARITQTYKVVRISLNSPCTGPGGPGDLAWIWQITTMVLLPLVIFRRKQKRKA